MDFRLRLRPLNAQILQDRRQDRLLLGRPGGQLGRDRGGDVGRELALQLNHHT